MFRFYEKLPHGVIKIPHAINICFEELPVEVIQQVGETKANVEQVKEDVEEHQEKIEEIEQAQKWSDESISRAFEKLWTLQDRVDVLEVEVQTLKEKPVEEPAKEEPKPAETTEVEKELSELPKPEEKETKPGFLARILG